MLLAAGGLVVLAAGGAALVLDGPEQERRPGRLVSVVVPSGTAARIAAGRPVRAVPSRIVARAGDTLRLVNRDRASHTLGPFLVGPGETMTSHLARPGTYTGDCTAHPTQKFAIVVRP